MTSVKLKNITQHWTGKTHVEMKRIPLRIVKGILNLHHRVKVHVKCVTVRHPILGEAVTHHPHKINHMIQR